MIFRATIGRWRFTFTLAPTTKVTGVNSTLHDGKHILMWDFDDMPLMEVKKVLEEIQLIYQLPQIRIFQTKKPMNELTPEEIDERERRWKNFETKGNYIAWCFKRCTFRKAVEIIISTKGVCWGYIKWSVYRKMFTSRVSDKDFRQIKLVWTLLSNIPEDVQVEELRSWVHYETLQTGFPMRAIEVQVPHA